MPVFCGGTSVSNVEGLIQVKIAKTNVPLFHRGPVSDPSICLPSEMADSSPDSTLGIIFPWKSQTGTSRNAKASKKAGSMVESAERGLSASLSTNSTAERHLVRKFELRILPVLAVM